ncbi:tyrosine-type recombinase/integrase [Paraburkholderia gardini]|uniref:tyrosine-type recombinase/integrase n=1 Tax=Paraburkholderia gardini TaxID=2823469 RepID=UPI001E3C7A36|nr:tyrosine-type recombinase/integrase [Paraburkholderia gardini]
MTDNPSDRDDNTSPQEDRQLTYEDVMQDYQSRWGGRLPSNPREIARYLREHGNVLPVATLKLRLAAISLWHQTHQFPDPARSAHVKSVLKEIEHMQQTVRGQARPLHVEQLEMVDSWLGQQIARESGSSKLPHLRNRALVLVGFWRGFRSDELTRLKVEKVTVDSGRSITIYIPRVDCDSTNSSDMTFRTAALAKLCPVAAYEAWIAASGLTSGPAFRSIDRWGTIKDNALASGSITPLLRGILRSSGVADADAYSSHSLRQGFAIWARSNAWDEKMLAEYVGWKDRQSARRYLDTLDPVRVFRA